MIHQGTITSSYPKKVPRPRPRETIDLQIFVLRMRQRPGQKRQARQERVRQRRDLQQLVAVPEANLLTSGCQVRGDHPGYATGVGRGVLTHPADALARISRNGRWENPSRGQPKNPG